MTATIENRLVAGRRTLSRLGVRVGFYRCGHGQHEGGLGFVRAQLSSWADHVAGSRDYRN